MKFGIFSNGLRHNKVAADSYDEDLAEIVAADRLGYHEAWVSEHMGAWLPDAVPMAELLIAKAAGVTSRIKLAPAVRLSPLFHPLDLAVSAAMCDHLLRGRYLFGFGSGVPFLKNMERRGLTNDMRHPMMMESIEFVLKAWTATEPFDWHGKYWQGTDIVCVPHCYQAPHPPIAVATGQTALIRMAAERGWTAIVSQFDAPGAIAARAKAYLDAAAETGGKGTRAQITVARHVFVAGSVAEARATLRDDVQRALEEWKKVNPERFKGYLPPGAKVENLDFDRTFDSGLFIGGDPDTVFRQLRDVYEASGGFGTLLLVMGKDWAGGAARERSLDLFMREVAPRLEALAAH
jgi:alkanesulfonate monooxygenase SsuD/methylene tetrahydromethanopterin reductase-like flavin-dependent oxidoreductase (luciferase family)